jgi:hypothetical protein
MRGFGFWSSAYYCASWIDSGMTMVASWLVTGELCHHGFRAYRGIWAVAWRLLLILSGLFILHATYDASKVTNGIGTLILVLQRDLAMASAVILVAILIIERSYGSQLEGFERQIAIGLCVYLVTLLLSNSLLIRWYAAHWPSTSGYPPSIRQLEAWWNGVRFVVVNIVLGAWCFALRKPLPAPKSEPIRNPSCCRRTPTESSRPRSTIASAL